MIKNARIFCSMLCKDLKVTLAAIKFYIVEQKYLWFFFYLLQLMNWNYKFWSLKQHNFGHNFADTINPFVNAIFLFPWNRDSFPFFLCCPKNIIYHTTLMDELSNVGNTITSLKQNDFLNVILYEDKNFDSNNNQSVTGIKTLIGIAIKVYSLQPSDLSDTLNDWTNHFFEQFY